MKKFLLPLSVVATVIAIVMFVEGAVTYPPSGSSSTTVVTNVTVLTNVDIIITTNLTTTIFNVSGKATMQIVTTTSTTATNGFFVVTNTWSGGPTGTVDMAKEDNYYASATACSITGLANRSNIVVQSSVITLTNSSATNWLLTLASGINIPQRANQVTVSNGSQATLSLRYHPLGGTNAVFVQF